ncbi:MAG: SAM hydrolase/SAM-dependent halogenase family protein [Chitinophagaceae bacterium]
MAIVTLSTDIGQQDYIIGAIKGQLLSCNRDINIVDISHYLSQSNFPEAAYICGNAFDHFPENTIHIILLHFFESKVDHLLLVKYKNQFIICANNGIITMIANGEPFEAYKISFDNTNIFLETTMLIAKKVNELIKDFLPNSIATLTTDYIIKLPLQPTISSNWIKGQIIFIDNFENVVVNITKPIFEEHRKGRRFNIVLKRNEVIGYLSDNYLSVNEGEKLAWFNSAGYLELAVNKGNMAGLFGLEGFNEINYKEGKSMQNKLFYTTATILFEDE